MPSKALATLKARLSRERTDGRSAASTPFCSLTLSVSTRRTTFAAKTCPCSRSGLFRLAQGPQDSPRTHTEGSNSVELAAGTPCDAVQTHSSSSPSSPSLGSETSGSELPKETLRGESRKALSSAKAHRDNKPTSEPSPTSRARPASRKSCTSSGGGNNDRSHASNASMTSLAERELEPGVYG